VLFRSSKWLDGLNVNTSQTGRFSGRPFSFPRLILQVNTPD
jgi:hypothetical protein